MSKPDNLSYFAISSVYYNNLLHVIVISSEWLQLDIEVDGQEFLVP